MKDRKYAITTGNEEVVMEAGPIAPKQAKKKSAKHLKKVAITSPEVFSKPKGNCSKEEDVGAEGDDESDPPPPPKIRTPKKKLLGQRCIRI